MEKKSNITDIAATFFMIIFVVPILIRGVILIVSKVAEWINNMIDKHKAKKAAKKAEKSKKKTKGSK